MCQYARIVKKVPWLRFFEWKRQNDDLHDQDGDKTDLGGPADRWGRLCTSRWGRGRRNATTTRLSASRRSWGCYGHCPCHSKENKMRCWSTRNVWAAKKWEILFLFQKFYQKSFLPRRVISADQQTKADKSRLLVSNWICSGHYSIKLWLHAASVCRLLFDWINTPIDLQGYQENVNAEIIHLYNGQNSLVQL